MLGVVVCLCVVKLMFIVLLVLLVCWIRKVVVLLDLIIVLFVGMRFSVFDGLFDGVLMKW